MNSLRDDYISRVVDRGIELSSLQWRDESVEFMSMIMDIKAECIIEIGVHMGGTSYMLLRSSEPYSLHIGIDLYTGYHEDWIETIRKFPTEYQRLELLFEDSRLVSTYNKVEYILNGRKADVLFIDGGHTYENTKSDYDMYSGLVRGGGIVAIHDIVVNHSNVPPNTTYGTDRFWNEVKNSNSIEIIHEPSVYYISYGVGVLYN